MTTTFELLSPRQEQSIRECTARINLWYGAISSGKTFASQLAWLEFVATAPPGALLMVGNTKETIERNVIDPLMEPEMWAPYPVPITHTRGSGTAIIFGRLVHVVGASDAKAEKRIRGMTLAGAYVDEATLLPGLGYWNQLLGRLRVPGARLFATTNPDIPTHWLKQDVLDRQPELDMRSWHFRLEDNPSLTDDYKRQIRAENVGMWRDRFILGLWVAGAGAIYSMFDPDRHVVADLPRDDGGRPAIEAWLLGVDYGTANPFDAGLLGVGYDDCLYVARGWRWDSRKKRSQLTDAEYSKLLRTWVDDDLRRDLGLVLDLHGVHVDPSAASFSTQLHRDHWSGVRNADNEVLDGIRTVASLLAVDRLKFVDHPSLSDGMAELIGYQWDDDALKLGEEKPTKVDDHFPDQVRYGVRAARPWWRHWLTGDLADAA